MNRLIRARTACLLAVAILFAGCVRTTPERPEEDTLPSLAPPPGDDADPGRVTPAPAEDEGAAAPVAGDGVTLQVVDREDYQRAIDRYRGKVVLVDFWATWCTPCIEKFPHTVHVSRAFPKDQLAVISVSLDDPENRDAALAFLQKHEARFENLLSAEGVVESMEIFDIDAGIPHYKIYDRAGNLAKAITPGPDLDVTLELLEREVRQVIERA
jgi:thiol-disulfide isomerase/thioredoxin